MISKIKLLSLLSMIFLFSCHEKEAATSNKKIVIVTKVKPTVEIQYHFEKPVSWLKQNTDSVSRLNVFAINRTDLTNLCKMDSILVPNDTKADISYYLPFPAELTAAKQIDKVIFFSYATQSFGAYEHGDLVYTGPTNMGRKKDQTPTGLFFTNWKAEKTTSTFDDEWELKWNFNIENKEGVGWHQYELPGYPASHSCLRLSETDAKYLYTWADQWKLDHDTVQLKGTPVIVFGSYDFDAGKPWLQLNTAPKILDISSDKLAEVLRPFTNEILQSQQKRSAPIVEKG